MNRIKAREIAETITNEQIQQMFDNAKTNIKDWEKRSIVNKSFTIGTGWNILTKGFNIDSHIHILVKTNMVREFGEFLPEKLKPIKKERGELPAPIHQNPLFEDLIK